VALFCSFTTDWVSRVLLNPRMSLRSKDEKIVRSALIWVYNCTHHDHEQRYISYLFILSLLLLKFPNGLGVLTLVLEFCDALVDKKQDMNFELCIGIVASVIEIDSLPVLYRSLRTTETTKVTLLKIMDGICHSILESKAPFLYINTTMFMIELLQETVDNEELVTKPIEEIQNISLKLYYILQFWKFVSEIPMKETSEKWATLGLHKTLIRKAVDLDTRHPCQSQQNASCCCYFKECSDRGNQWTSSLHDQIRCNQSDF
jgi:hypothetical protein